MILTKVLAVWLNKVILSLIHGDQTGFMPGKGMDINLRRLLTVVDRVGGNGSEVVASIDAVKAFDSVEWDYLWMKLHKFGCGPVFISWLQLLYSNLTARVCINGMLSSPFPLH